MKAAVVTSFDQPPRFTEFAEPRPGSDEILVDVLAAGLHPRVRAQADGSHYTSTGELPLVPGVDGVGRDPEGRLHYFVLDDTAFGAMAERTVIDARRSVVLSDDVDPVTVAAGANPALSSWVALRRRIAFETGQSVLILGATGSAGSMAVQVARLFGASKIVAAGRDPERLAGLAELGATTTVRLGTDASAEELAREASDVDVVLDYVWGELTTAAMTAIVTARPDRGRPLAWIEIGSVGGTTAAIPSAALRAARLSLVGSGQGSVSTRDIVAELPGIATAISSGRLRVDAHAVPLADVETTWADASSDARVVFVP
ncbi:MAG TPA: zinc-binding alcohol dehydrogenase family protein [Gryllotalpicola sp.]